MASEDLKRRPWLFYGGAVLAAVASSLLTLTHLPWRGVIGWGLLLVALVLLGAGAYWHRRGSNL